ncbi:MAG TPA: GvpL/GvpF family gas vesicle protein [Labilithrix sp.]|jgi:hypothetical protein
MAKATYVYCVVKSASAKPSLGKSPKGMPGAGAPRLLDVGGDYFAVVADAPLAAFSPEAIEPRLRDLDWVAKAGAAHEAVVEHALRAGTVVPMKLFTLFSSDERVRDHTVRTKKTLDRVVARISGCEEWGLRVLFDEARAMKRAARGPAPASGVAFLKRKKELGDVRRRLAADAKDEVEALYGRLAKAVKRAVRRAPPSQELAGSVLLDAAFLVPREKTKTFKSEVAKTAKGLAQNGYHVTLTGPWPAYSFVGGSP